MLRVAIVGCGKIADDHAALIKQLPICELVATCDQEPLMARQLAERYSVTSHFSDLRAMLASTRPDVVHVTTPPQSHFELAKTCLEAGSHVLIEKPFTVTAEEARRLVDVATHSKRKITVHHDQQFTIAARDARDLIAANYLGGPPLHIESYHNYELGEGKYAKAVLGDRGHWLRSLPGQLLHNVISHGISKIVEFIPSDSPAVRAWGFTSPEVRRLGEDLVDELRVLIRDGDRCTAYFTFSSRFRPCVHLLRLYGRENAIQIDHDQQTVVTMRGKRYTGVLEKLVPPFTLAMQHFRNGARNVRRFAGNDLHPRSGSVYLFRRFYDCIVNGGPEPFSHRDIVLTVDIMDEIFRQLNTARTEAPLRLEQSG